MAYYVTLLPTYKVFIFRVIITKFEQMEPDVISLAQKYFNSRNFFVFIFLFWTILFIVSKKRRTRSIDMVCVSNIRGEAFEFKAFFQVL